MPKKAKAKTNAKKDKTKIKNKNKNKNTIVVNVNSHNKKKITTHKREEKNQQYPSPMMPYVINAASQPQSQPVIIYQPNPVSTAIPIGKSNPIENQIPEGQRLGSIAKPLGYSNLLFTPPKTSTEIQTDDLFIPTEKDLKQFQDNVDDLYDELWDLKKKLRASQADNMFSLDTLDDFSGTLDSPESLSSLDTLSLSSKKKSLKKYWESIPRIKEHIPPDEWIKANTTQTLNDYEPNFGLNTNPYTENRIQNPPKEQKTEQPIPNNFLDPESNNIPRIIPNEFPYTPDDYAMEITKKPTRHKVDNPPPQKVLEDNMIITRKSQTIDDNAPNFGLNTNPYREKDYQTKISSNERKTRQPIPNTFLDPTSNNIQPSLHEYFFTPENYTSNYDKTNPPTTSRAVNLEKELPSIVEGKTPGKIRSVRNIPMLEPVEVEYEKPSLSTGAKRVPVDEPVKKAHQLTRHEMIQLMASNRISAHGLNINNLHEFRKVGDKYEIVYQRSKAKVSDNVVKRIYEEYYL